MPRSAAGRRPRSPTARTGVVSQAAGKPVGGNAGARAGGYTTSPDAVGATYGATSANNVTVTVDARLSAVDPTKFTLLTAFAEPPGGPATAANATAITVTFSSATAVNGAKPLAGCRGRDRHRRGESEPEPAADPGTLAGRHTGPP